MMNETAVSKMIQQIMYSNRDSYSPTPGIRTVRFQLWDETTVGVGLSSPGYDMWVNVVPTNDIPAFDSGTWQTGGQTFANYTGVTPSWPANVNGSAMYVEASTPFYARLESTAKIIDRDIEGTCGATPYSNFDGGYLTVKFDSEGFDSTEDRLGINITAGGLLSMIGSDIVSYNGSQIGIVTSVFAGTVGTLTISLNENAGTAAVDALIQNISYYNIDSDDPSVGLRTVRFSFADGDGGVTDSYQASDNYPRSDLPL